MFMSYEGAHSTQRGQNNERKKKLILTTMKIESPHHALIV
jgi:hypothetical protein